MCDLFATAAVIGDGPIRLLATWLAVTLLVALSGASAVARKVRDDEVKPW